MAKYKRPIKSAVSKTATIPLKDKKDIDLIMRCLLRRVSLAETEIKKKQARRNWMLVLLGLNTAFRVEDLVQLKVSDVSKGYFSIKENKTGKCQNYRINKYLFEDIKNYIKENELLENDYLFYGQKKSHLTPLTRQHVDRILKSVSKEINLRQKFSAHSLRKTWAYQKYKDGTPLITISKMLNHYDIEETLLYICWGDEDIDREREITYYGGVHR
jgi:site-specific recombinase XerD